MKTIKRILIAAIACITAVSSMAQTKSYRGFVEGGYGAFVGSKTGSVLSLSTSHGKMFGPVFVGGGIGIEQAWVKNESYIENYVSIGLFDGWRGVKTFKGINVPVFANIKGIWENKKISPTFDVKAGFNLGMACGLLGEAGAGCRFDLGKTALAPLPEIFFSLSMAVAGTLPPYEGTETRHMSSSPSDVCSILLQRSISLNSPSNAQHMMSATFLVPPVGLKCML